MNKQDYTDGLKFIPWLLKYRKGHLLGLFGNLILGQALLISSYPDIEGVCFGSFFGILVPILIGYLLKRDYNDLKQGFSR
jgi:hypothetical protein